MRHGRLRHLRRSGEIAHTQLARLEEGIEDAEPVRVREELEAVGQLLRFLRTHEPSLCGGHPSRVHRPHGTAIKAANFGRIRT